MKLEKKASQKTRGKYNQFKKKTNVEFTGIYLQTRWSLFLRLSIGVDKKEWGERKYVEGVFVYNV